MQTKQKHLRPLNTRRLHPFGFISIISCDVNVARAVAAHTHTHEKMPQEKQMANIWVFVVGRPGRCRCDALATEWTWSVNQNEVNAYVWKIRSKLATPFSVCLHHSISLSLFVLFYYYYFWLKSRTRKKKRRRRRQQPFIKCVTSK